MKKILAIIQARTSSKRLPSKVLLPINNTPMILFQLNRIKRSKLISKIILATSNDITDDHLANIVKANGYDIFRGSLDNVLDRYAKCAEKEGPDIIIRLTGDCPLTDPELIDEIIDFFLKSDYDYLGNGIEQSNLSVTDGFDIEIFSYDILKVALEKAFLPSELEHVTPWFRSKKSNFKWGHFNHSKKRSAYHRVTVDDLKDYELVTKIVEDIYPKNKNFGIDDVINFLENNPGIAFLNKATIRNEGLLKSLEEDKFFKEDQNYE